MSPTDTVVPTRSLDQRMEALKRANDIRVKRAQLKKGLKERSISPLAILQDPPDEAKSWRVLDMLKALPKFGDVKARRVLQECRVSHAKTLEGLSERQRTELVKLVGDFLQSRYGTTEPVGLESVLLGTAASVAHPVG